MNVLRSRLPSGPLAARLGARLLAYTGSWAFTSPWPCTRSTVTARVRLRQ